MQPFSISERGKSLVGPFPEPGTVRVALPCLSYGEMEGFLRQWVSEGVPFAFRDIPMLYEVTRGWIGSELGVHAKQITIIGSGRLGYSLCGLPKFGKLFSMTSDFDWSVIATDLFEKFCADFFSWREEFDRELVLPRNERERKFWTSNRIEAVRSIRRGFLDDWRVPRRRQYATCGRIADTIWRLDWKMKRTASAPSVSHHSFRIFKDWNAMLAHMMTNLGLTLRSFQKVIP